MAKYPIVYFIKQLGKPVFTTNELSFLSGKSLSVTTQALNNLEKNGVVEKIYRGVWSGLYNGHISPYTVIPSLFQVQRVYISFISALHLYGIIEQIPQVITLASTGHTRTIRTKAGVYDVHRINPAFFEGFDWYKRTGSFLIAEPEKALVDSLYLSMYKKKRFGYFPELNFPESFSFRKVKKWIEKIPNKKIRGNIYKKIELIQKREKIN